MALSAAGFLASAVSVCSNGVAQTVPVVIDAGRGRYRRAALPHPWQGRHRARCWLAGTWQCCWGGLGTPGALVWTPLRVTGVGDWLPPPAGSFTHVHLAASFPVCAS